MIEKYLFRLDVQLGERGVKRDVRMFRGDAREEKGIAVVVAEDRVDRRGISWKQVRRGKTARKNRRGKKVVRILARALPREPTAGGPGDRGCRSTPRSSSRAAIRARCRGVNVRTVATSKDFARGCSAAVFGDRQVSRPADTTADHEQRPDDRSKRNQQSARLGNGLFPGLRHPEG